MAEKKAMLLKSQDNVAIAITELKIGETVIGDDFEIQVRNVIPRNHKVAIRELGRGEAVIKHGEIIGYAAERIQAGEWVHTHNLKMEAE